MINQGAAHQGDPGAGHPIEGGVTDPETDLEVLVQGEVAGALGLGQGDEEAPGIGIMLALMKMMDIDCMLQT